MSDDTPYIVGFPYEQYGKTIQSTPEGHGYMSDMGQGTPKPSILSPSLSAPAPRLAKENVSVPKVSRGLPSERMGLKFEHGLDMRPGLDFEKGIDLSQKPVPNMRPKPNKMTDSEMSAAAQRMLDKIESDRAAIRQQPRTVNAEGKQQYFDPGYANEMAKRGINVPSAPPMERSIPSMESSDMERQDRQRRVQAYMKQTGASMDDVMDAELHGRKLDLPETAHLDRQNQLQIHQYRTGENMQSVMDKELHGIPVNLPTADEANRVRTGMAPMGMGTQAYQTPEQSQDDYYAQKQREFQAGMSASGLGPDDYMAQRDRTQ